MAYEGYEAWLVQPESDQPPVDEKPEQPEQAEQAAGEAVDAAGEAVEAAEESAEAAREAEDAALTTEAEVQQENLARAGEAGSEFVGSVLDGDFDSAAQNAEALVLAAIPVVLNIGVGLLILLVALFISGRARRIVEGGARKSRVDETLSKFFGQMAKWAVLILGLVIAIGKIGIPTASFVAVIGGASLAIGLAFQGSLGNLAAGVMLLIFRPFKVGDVVQVGGVTAKVNEIDLFTTLLDTFDNRRIIMPNGNIFGNEIENITHHTTRRVDVKVGTEYPAEIDRVREVLERVATTVEGGLGDPAPQVYLLELGDSSINWVIRVWSTTADYWAVRERITRNVKYALDEAGIGIPFPQMDVHINGELRQA